MTSFLLLIIPGAQADDGDKQCSIDESHLRSVRADIVESGKRKASGQLKNVLLERHELVEQPPQGHHW